jgi:hypothetical protein
MVDVGDQLPCPAVEVVNEEQMSDNPATHARYLFTSQNKSVLNLLRMGERSSPFLRVR